MKKLTLTALAALATVVPTFVSAAVGPDVRIISTSRIGGLDGVRAAAVAGSPVTRTVMADHPGLARYFDRHGIENGELDGLFMDANGTLWAYVDKDED